MLTAICCSCIIVLMFKSVVSYFYAGKIRSIKMWQSFVKKERFHTQYMKCKIHVNTLDESYHLKKLFHLKQSFLITILLPGICLWFLRIWIVSCRSSAWELDCMDGYCEGAESVLPGLPLCVHSPRRRTSSSGVLYRRSCTPYHGFFLNETQGNNAAWKPSDRSNTCTVAHLKYII